VGAQLSAHDIIGAAAIAVCFGWDATRSRAITSPLESSSALSSRYSSFMIRSASFAPLQQQLSAGVGRFLRAFSGSWMKRTNKGKTRGCRPACLPGYGAVLKMSGSRMPQPNGSTPSAVVAQT